MLTSISFKKFGCNSLSFNFVLSDEKTDFYLPLFVDAYRS